MYVSLVSFLPMTTLQEITDLIDTHVYNSSSPNIHAAVKCLLNERDRVRVSPSTFKMLLGHLNAAVFGW